jgi:hypothetical protein
VTTGVTNGASEFYAANDDSNLDAMIPARSVLAARAISDRLARARHGATDRRIHCAEFMTSRVMNRVTCGGMNPVTY